MSDERKQWRTSTYRILNRLRQGPATADELLVYTNHKDKTSKENGWHLVATNIRSLERVGHRFFKVRSTKGKTLYKLVHDAERDVAQSYWAIESMQGPVMKVTGWNKVPSEEDLHKKDGPVIIKQGEPRKEEEKEELKPWQIRELRYAESQKKKQEVSSVEEELQRREAKQQEIPMERDDEMVKIGERIRKLRVEKNMHQRELADAVGFKHDTAISNIEVGLSRTTMTKMKRIADALGVTLSQLFTDDEPTSTSVTPKAHQEAAYYETFDISLAAAMLCLKIEPVKKDDSIPGRMRFYYSSDDETMKLIEDYYQGRMLVDPKLYSQSHKQLRHNYKKPRYPQDYS